MELEGAGMTGVETIARIRFEHYQNRKGIKRIARELGLARDTVRKVLRSNATAFAYKRAVQPQPKLGPWIAALTAILEAEAKLPKRERRSTLRLFEELRGAARTRLRRRARQRAPLRQDVARGAGPAPGPGLCAAAV